MARDRITIWGPNSGRYKPCVVYDDVVPPLSNVPSNIITNILEMNQLMNWNAGAERGIA